MNAMNQAISSIDVVPVIKLNHLERDSAPLAVKIMKETCPDMIVGAGAVTTAQIGEAIEAFKGVYSCPIIAA